MHLLVPLLVAAAAVCAIARPGPSQELVSTQNQRNGPSSSTRGLFNEYYLPRLLMTQYMDYDGSPVAPQPSRDDWLNKEIDRINRMEDEVDSAGSYEKNLARIFSREPYLVRMFDSPTNIRDDNYALIDYRRPYVPDQPAIGNKAADTSESYKKPQKIVNPILIGKDIEHRRNFALTPNDNGYFDSLATHTAKPVTKSVDGHHEGGGVVPIQLQPPRQIRQNPNLSKTKHLIADNLDQLRAGLLHEDSGTTEKPRSIHMMEAAPVDPADSIYGIAVIAAVGTALVLAIIGFGFGWYTMTKRAKAAADVDYPAYGVTGPTVDMSGDRKLAHSAHMYHYQHQKQQIIAMERNGMEQRNGSISEPESEEENEEGDYTVYECPGFATTGDMEVKNPLFSEEPTPATPGKCELVKPQPKE